MASGTVNVAYKNLKGREHKLVITRGVNDKIAEDAKFAKFVHKSLIRFNRGDWGDVSEEDKKANDADLESLNNDGWSGRILASYSHDCSWQERHIWITLNTAEEDGTRATTIMFPSEY